MTVVSEGFKKKGVLQRHLFVEEEKTFISHKCLLRLYFFLWLPLMHQLVGYYNVEEKRALELLVKELILLKIPTN